MENPEGQRPEEKEDLDWDSFLEEINELKGKEEQEEADRRASGGHFTSTGHFIGINLSEENFEERDVKMWKRVKNGEIEVVDEDFKKYQRESLKGGEARRRLAEYLANLIERRRARKALGRE